MGRTRRRKPLTRRRAPLARRAEILLLLFVLGSLANSLHGALVPHRTCAHGELVHDEPGAPHAPVGGDDHLVSGELRAASAPNEADREHEHCALATPLRFGSTSDEPELCSALAPATTPSAIRQGPARCESFPRYLLAPHHSPPAS